jgi:DNA polymerase-3 subunit epsilon
VQPDGTPVFNFGKYTGQPVKDVLAKDKNYYFWILEKEFSSQLKQIVKQLMREVEKK